MFFGGSTGSQSARTVSSASSRSSRALLEAVLEQALDVLLVVAVERAAGVVGDGAFERVEQVLVVDDVAVVLVVAVEAVDAADGLEEAVVLHLLVDVEVGGAAARRSR